MGRIGGGRRGRGSGGGGKGASSKASGSSSELEDSPEDGGRIEDDDVRDKVVGEKIGVKLRPTCPGDRCWGGDPRGVIGLIW